MTTMQRRPRSRHTARHGVASYADPPVTSPGVDMVTFVPTPDRDAEHFLPAWILDSGNWLRNQASVAAHLMHFVSFMSRGPAIPSLFDEEKIRLVREFLRREFRGYQHRDYCEFHTRIHVFVMETEQGVRHTLAITKRTFDEGDFGRLLNANLVTTLQEARGRRVTVTPRGVRED